MFSNLGVASAAVDDNLGLATFLRRYAQDGQLGPFSRAPEFAAGSKEWQIEFQQGQA